MSEPTYINQHERYDKGMELFDRGLYMEAIEEFERVLESSAEGNAPERKLASFYICEAYTNLGLSHLRMNLYRRAEEDLKLALMIHPEYADLHLHLALVFYKEGRYDDAETQIREALTINPRFARALIYLGLVRLQRGSEEGLAAVADAVALQPVYDGDTYERALALCRGGGVEQALSLIEEIAETDVDQISCLLDRGGKLMKQDAHADASNAFLEAISICPDYADLRYRLGICYLRQGLTDLAVGQFAKALDINPAFIAARVNLAAAYEKGGEIGRAVEEVECVLRLDPGNPIARRMLARLRQKQ